jgi:hypothetical protein
MKMKQTNPRITPPRIKTTPRKFRLVSSATMEEMSSLLMVIILENQGGRPLTKMKKRKSEGSFGSESKSKPFKLSNFCLFLVTRPSVRNHCHKAKERVTSKGTDKMWDRAPLGSYCWEFSIRLTGGVCHPVPTNKGIVGSSQRLRSMLLG